ncbi:MAG: MBL fold metallo-hydrolase [Candidatus Syntrophonatronum acetioxidans]|uniref:MBL fold metallo-hydrolase n=1 Tax=Candidatus Syntrophonatronum acetioxidans TaxID=1795816 RepID=A0A424YI00_9FIRM|nr:MAG: MBL fold metallo-hydrolase [Candidatus Syntrophonatronum acetioxidans]
MKVTILGKYGPYPPAGGSCSGYLLEGENTKILLDCGNGVFNRLQRFIPHETLDAVVISHLHWDHVADLFIFRYAVERSLVRGRRKSPLEVYTLTEPWEIYSFLPFLNAVDIKPVNRYGEIQLGEFKLNFLPTVHSKPCCAIKVENEGKVLTYSGDTEYFEGLIDFVSNSHLFLCEANFLARDLALNRSNHLASFQAAQIAREGGVKDLKLTHLHPENPEEEVLSEARAEFNRVEVAKEGEVIIL